MSLKITGLDEVKKQLKQLDKNAKELAKTDHLPLPELFPRSFMRKYTSFASIDELFDAGGFKVESQKDFEAIPDNALDKHIAANTKFQNWEKMKQEAVSQYATKKLGF